MDPHSNVFFSSQETRPSEKMYLCMDKRNSKHSANWVLGEKERKEIRGNILIKYFLFSNVKRKILRNTLLVKDSNIFTKNENTIPFSHNFDNNILQLQLRNTLMITLLKLGNGWFLDT